MASDLWATSAVTDEEAKASVVLVTSLRRNLTRGQTAVLVSPSGVSVELRNKLHESFDHVVILEEDTIPGDLGVGEFAQICIFKLKFFRKIVFLPANIMILRNPDDLFKSFGVADLATFFGKGNSSIGIFGVKPSLQGYYKVAESVKTGVLDSMVATLERIFDKKLSTERKESWILEIGKGKRRKFLGKWSNTRMVKFTSDPVQIVKELLGNKSCGLVEHTVAKMWFEIYSSHFSSSGSIPRPLIPALGFSEPIAIIGMSCRYPGSDSVKEFWNLLISGEEAISKPPQGRWLGAPSEEKLLTGGYLKSAVDEFDAAFFGISGKEAVTIDPQQRILLEVVWEGLEDASIPPTSLKGTNTGVFVGSWTNDFKAILNQSGVTNFYRSYMGNSIGTGAARIAHVLELTGPTVATESGCSSSMVGVHLACKSLQRSETNLALACGVNLLLTYYDESYMPQALSPDGKCKTFDASANGFSRAEGCGVLVLKRLSDALLSNDRIWGIIRGSGISQEGLSHSMGTPTVHSEAVAMETALLDGDTDPDQVSYVETHGTGTVVGDPIEIKAMERAYGSKTRKEPLQIGSVKTNVGHTESCSGITGIMKVLLAMKHGMIPAHRNLKVLNPAINFSAIPAIIPTSPVEWKSGENGKRIAGVSSFGITGTDAHVILEDGPKVENEQIFGDGFLRNKFLMKVSARTEPALKLLMEKYADFLGSDEEFEFPDVCYSANVGRADLGFRAVVLAPGKEEAVEILKTGRMKSTEVRSGEARVAFLFTGQGSQYPGMGKELYETCPEFKIHFDHCAALLREHGCDFDMAEVLWNNKKDKDGAALRRTIYSQTSIFCLEYALFKNWESWGVTPSYVVGHSLGEFAAAVAAGILSLEEAVILVANRSRLIDQLPVGGMLVLRADFSKVENLIKGFSKGDRNLELDFAALNSKDQTVLAGDTKVVVKFAEFCEEKGLKVKVLEATHAFHSKHMDPMLKPYFEIASELQKRESKCQFISGVTGESETTLDANYWVKHTREKVNFLKVTETLGKVGCEIFLELGPQPVLSTFVLGNLEESKITCIPSLRKGEPEWSTILGAVGQLYLSNVKIDWEGMEEHLQRKKVSLPHYPFIRKRYWPEGGKCLNTSLHPLIGSKIPNASSCSLFENEVNLEDLDFIKDHVIGSKIVFPGACYLEMCLAAGVASVTGKGVTSSLRPAQPVTLQGLQILAPFNIIEGKLSRLQTVAEWVTSEDGEGLALKICQEMSSSTDGKWLEHSKATFIPWITPGGGNEGEFNEAVVSSLLHGGITEEIFLKEVYRTLDRLGLHFGPLFKSLEAVWQEKDVFVAKLRTPSLEDSENYVLHPIIIDAMIQSVMISSMMGNRLRKKLCVPIKISKFVYLAAPSGSNFYVTVDAKKASAILFQTEDLKTFWKVGVMSGVEFMDTTVRGIESVIDQQISAMPHLWEQAWKEYPGRMECRLDLASSSGFFYSQEFAAKCDALYNRVQGKAMETFEDLEEVVYFTILRGLYSCGWRPSPGQIFNDVELLQLLGVKTSFVRYFNYLLIVLEGRGILRKVKAGVWEYITPAPSIYEVIDYLTSSKITKVLAEEIESTKLVLEIGENLKEILQGSKSPLNVLFPSSDAGYPPVSIIYEDIPALFSETKLAVDVMTQRCQNWLKTSSGQKKIVRILEIGAGTGYYTAIILETFDKLGIPFEFTYTDISPAFFPPAEKKFLKFRDRLKFKRLDIEEDPIGQGFTPEYYDYVIAAEVIHATKNIHESLSNVWKLLRNHGSFDIVEETKVNSLITFVFGMLDGYWRFEDFELRPNHCTMSITSWRGAFEECGFKVTGEFPCMSGLHALICTEKNVSEGSFRLEDNKKTWIVYHSAEEELSGFLVDKLETLGRQVLIVTRAEKGVKPVAHNFFMKESSKSEFEAVAKTISSSGADIEGILYCWGLPKRQNSQDIILQPLLYLVQSLPHLGQRRPPKVISITRGTAAVEGHNLENFYASTIAGFVRTMKNENADTTCRCIDIQTPLSNFGMLEVFQEVMSDSEEPHVSLAGEKSRYVAKFQPHKVTTSVISIPSGSVDRYQLLLPESRSISDLKFGPLSTQVVKGSEMEVQIKASALNFKDVLNILKPTAEFKNSNTVGVDIAGIVTKVGSSIKKFQVGDLVFGANFQNQPLRSHLILKETDLLKVPDLMTLSEAVTLPTVFATAYHCLIEVAKLTSSDTILIHAASGGVGLVAIQIAKFIGARVIATAGTRRKREYLKSIGIEYVFHSRNTNYQEEISMITSGSGVNVVLNSLTSEGFKEASLGVCAPSARFVEMSKLSIWSEKEVRELRPDVEYYIVDVSTMAERKFQNLMRKLEDCLRKGITKPLPHVRFPAVNIIDALGYLQRAKHIGKVVCLLPEVKIGPGTFSINTCIFNEKSTYLITGGLGGIGIEIAKWMVAKGAKNVILAGRNSPSLKIQEVINSLNSSGANIIPTKCDISNYTGLRMTLQQIRSELPPLRGVMHAAGQLADSLIANQTWEKFQSVFQAKVTGTINLHNLTYADHLEHFVVFSSCVALFGSNAQANHAAGNYFEDMFIQYRHSLGLPGTSINWGPWGQVGVATDVDYPGLKHISTSQAVTALEYILNNQVTQLCVTNIDSFTIFSKVLPMTATYLDDGIRKTVQNNRAGNSKCEEFWTDFDILSNPLEKLDLIKVHIKGILYEYLKRDESEVIKDDENFKDLGFDSLMFVEIKNSIQYLLGSRASVSASVIRDNSTINLLSRKLLSLIEIGEAEITTFEDVSKLIREDSKLPERISGGGKEAKRIEDVRKILLTGVTGTLGPYVLKELVNLEQIEEVYCLVRQRKGKSLEEVVEEVLKEKCLQVKLDKVKVISGDLGKDRLGMEEEVWESLVTVVDAVFHSAAAIDHMEEYVKDDIGVNARTSNVLGTVRILEFAGEGNLKHVFFASSLTAVITTGEDGRLSESWPEVGDFDGVTTDGYPISKFVGDLLTKQAVERGIPCKTFRLPWLSGEGGTGLCKIEQNHPMMRYLHILKIGLMPSNLTPLLMAPVDRCARVCVRISFNAQAPNEIYNVTPSDPPPEQEYAKVAEEFGRKVEIIEFEKFAQKIWGDEGDSPFLIFKEYYRDTERRLFLRYGTTPAFKNWRKGVDGFWRSEKIMKYAREFYDEEEPVLTSLRQDVIFAKENGWFEKFGLK